MIKFVLQNNHSNHNVQIGSLRTETKDKEVIEAFCCIGGKKCQCPERLVAAAMERSVLRYVQQVESTRLGI